MTSLERSPNVQGQLKLMEEHVLRYKHRYNSMRNERKRKEELLFRLTTQATFPEDKTQSSDVLTANFQLLKGQLEDALAHLDQEHRTTEELTYMKESRHMLVLSSKEPIRTMRNELRKINLAIVETNEENHRTVLDFKEIAVEQKNMAHFCSEKHAKRDNTLVQMAKEYQDQQEIMEFLKRKNQQKSIQRKIRNNEETVHELKGRVQDMEEEATVERDVKSNERKVGEHERRYERLIEITGATDLSGIMDNWHYLQTTKLHIDRTIRKQEKKIGVLNTVLCDLTAELTKIQLAQESLVTNTTIETAKRKAKDSDKVLSTWKTEVSINQLTHWDLLIHHIGDCLCKLCAQISAEDQEDLKNLSIEELLSLLLKQFDGLLMSYKT